MFGTSYVGFGSDPTYTQKIMKIPDIAWPTFFDSYRESMLNIKQLYTVNLILTYCCLNLNE